MTEKLEQINLELRKIDRIIELLERHYNNNLDNPLKCNELLAQLMECRKMRREIVSYKNKAASILKELKKSTVQEKSDKVFEKKEDSYVLDSINFNAYNNNWKISYHKNGKEYTRDINTTVEEYLLAKKEIKTLSKQNKKRYNAQKYMILKSIDRQMNTEFTSKYLKGDLNSVTIYDLKHIFKNRYYSLKEKTSILLAANRDKYRLNTQVINPKVSAVPAVIAAMLGISLFAGMNNINAGDNKIKNNVAIEQDFAVKEAVKEEVEVVPNTADIDREADSNKLDSVSFIGDNYYLSNINLSRQALNESRSVNTNKLNCSYYKISYICVTKDNSIIDIVNANKTKDYSINELCNYYYDNYGQDIEFYLNFNGYDENNNMTYEKIGWTNINNVHNNLTNENSKVLKKID